MKLIKQEKLDKEVVDKLNYGFVLTDDGLYLIEIIASAKSWLREAFEDTLTANNEILAYAVGEDMNKALSEKYFKDYFKRRTLKNIAVRVIAPDTPESRAVIVNDAAELRTSLLVPKEQFYFSIEMNIYNNKIMIASWREKFALIIESEEIAGAQRKIFELAWAGAKTM